MVFVGQATSLFETKETNLMIYDTESIKCRPTGCTLQEFVVCDIVFFMCTNSYGEKWKMSYRYCRKCCKTIKRYN